MKEKASEEAGDEIERESVKERMLQKNLCVCVQATARVFVHGRRMDTQLGETESEWRMERGRR